MSWNITGDSTFPCRSHTGLYLSHLCFSESSPASFRQQLALVRTCSCFLKVSLLISSPCINSFPARCHLVLPHAPNSKFSAMRVHATNRCSVLLVIIISPIAENWEVNRRQEWLACRKERAELKQKQRSALKDELWVNEIVSSLPRGCTAELHLALPHGADGARRPPARLWQLDSWVSVFWKLKMLMRNQQTDQSSRVMFHLLHFYQYD